MESDGRSDAIKIRKYGSEDAIATLAVFLAAVTETAAGDYSFEQIAAWSRSGQRVKDLLPGR